MCLFICKHVYMCSIWVLCMYVSICVSVLSLCLVPINECYAYMYVCVCVNLYVCIRLYAYIHLYACLHLCVHV